MKLAAALAAGCTVVLKPPELAPFSSTLFAEVAHASGLPPGVLNVVTGAAETGERLVRHPLVAKLSFTGSPATGRRVQAACADGVKPVLLELGGKSASIVFADADLDRAISSAVAGITTLSGQVCVAPTRLLVERKAYDEVVSRIAGLTAEVRIGDPTDPDTVMGPVISERRLRQDHATGRRGGCRRSGRTPHRRIPTRRRAGGGVVRRSHRVGWSPPRESDRADRSVRARAGRNRLF